MRRAFILICAVVLSLIGGGSAHAAKRISPGCPADRSTFIGGDVYGIPDNRAIDAHIGVSVGYKDAAGKLHVVMPDGSPNPSTAGDYSWVDRINPDVPATGTTDASATRRWGQCVWGGVTVWYAEFYPKAPVDADHDQPNQVTDKSRYGSTAYYSGQVTEGATVDVPLRAPVTFEADPAGNTGGLQGYITYAGHPIPTTPKPRMRAFPGPGVTCGVEGYSAAADQIATGATGATYYAMRALAGGQCGYPSQNYSFQVSAVIDGVTRSFVRQVSITKGQTPRMDIVLS